MTGPAPSELVEPESARERGRWESTSDPRRHVRSGWTRVAVAGVATLAALNVALVVVGELLPSPSGPRSSSHATAPKGLAALADLLDEFGHPVSRVRELPGEARLDPRSTVVVLDPDALSGAEARTLRRFARSGGRLLTGGRDPDTWIEALLGADPGWEGTAPRVWRAGASVAGVDHVHSAGEGRWREPGPGVATVKGGRGTLLLSVKVGRGRMLLLADASPLQNRLLARADNAALALALAGERGRPVAFVESVHGYGQARGLAALPTRWKLALAGLTLAGLVFLAARARRLGLPDPPPASAPPPRRAYVDALAAALERVHDPAAAAAPVQAATEMDRTRRDH